MVHIVITRMLILLIVLLDMGWDVYLLAVGDRDAMFSVVLYESAKLWPVIGFVAGFLCGHVFWQVYS